MLGLVSGLGQCPGLQVETSWVWPSSDSVRWRCRATAGGGCCTTAAAAPAGRPGGESTPPSVGPSHYLTADAACSRSSAETSRRWRRRAGCAPHTTAAGRPRACNWTPPSGRWSRPAVGAPGGLAAAAPGLSVSGGRWPRGGWWSSGWPPARPRAAPLPAAPVAPMTRRAGSQAPAGGASWSRHCGPATSPGSAPDAECLPLVATVGREEKKKNLI